MYGPIAGGLPPAAAGGALASTGSPALGAVVASALALMVVGVALVRRSRIAAASGEVEAEVEAGGKRDGGS
ncbi:hypothetical protein [Kitasatospora sp. NPDC101183]|uniref:hypothetical protein n=1 Tax=Kitasatospora sp. NPDC101183 TaxID=3364100 RepID=UPI00382C276B